MSTSLLLRTLKAKARGHPSISRKTSLRSRPRLMGGLECTDGWFENLDIILYGTTDLKGLLVWVDLPSRVGVHRRYLDPLISLGSGRTVKYAPLGRGVNIWIPLPSTRLGVWGRARSI